MKHVLIGNRIPKDYFITKGSGESDITVHAGSYHLALKEAGIEKANIMTYSSIMPSIAQEITKPDIIHGEVMECIMSVGTAEKNNRTSVGIIYGWLYNRETCEKYGGLVCERQEDMSEDELLANLFISLDELYSNGFSDIYELKDIKTITNSIRPSKKFGTTIVAICFTSYLIPLL